MRRAALFLLVPTLLLGAAPMSAPTPSAELRTSIQAALRRPTGVATLPPGEADAKVWAEHAAGSVVAAPRFELRVDCDAARSATPGDFNASATSRLLQAWNLSNGRSAALRAELLPADKVASVGLDGSPRPGAVYAGPPLVRAELSWSPRSVPGSVRRRSVSDGTWPAGLGLAPPSGAWLQLLRVDPIGLGGFSSGGELSGWPGVARLAVETIGLADSGLAPEEWAAAWRAWHASHEDLFRSACGSLGRWAIVGGLSSGDGLFVVAETTGTGQRAEAALQKLADGFAPVITRQGQAYVVKPGGSRLVPSFAWTTRSIGSRVWLVGVIGADEATPVAERAEAVAASLAAPAEAPKR